MRVVIAFSMLILSALLASEAANPVANPSIKVGFLTVGPVSDCGYNYSHNLGRLALESHLPGTKTTLAENIPENADAARVMERMVAQGNKLIFCTAYGYLESGEKVASHRPDAIIMQAWRPTHMKNMGTFAVYQYEPLYAVGMVAGRMTKTNKLGFIAGHPVPNLLQNINAFTLGARSVNPNVKVHVVWTNSWSDPAVEAESAHSLIEHGIDVLGSALDNPLTVLKTAQRSHVMVFGTYADMQREIPEYWTTGSCWNWDKPYLEITKSVENGTWRPGARWYGIKDGAVALASFGKIVPKDVKEQALAENAKVQSGKKIIFQGPIEDREGVMRLTNGQIASEKSLSEMDWFVKGVEGALPKK